MRSINEDYDEHKRQEREKETMRLDNLCKAVERALDHAEQAAGSVLDALVWWKPTAGGSTAGDMHRAGAAIDRAVSVLQKMLDLHRADLAYSMMPKPGATVWPAREI